MLSGADPTTGGGVSAADIDPSDKGPALEKEPAPEKEPVAENVSVPERELIVAVPVNQIGGAPAVSVAYSSATEPVVCLLC